MYITGRIYGLRDATLIRMVDNSKAPPVSLEGYPCMHTAPGVRKVEDKYEKVSIGPTTSMRMDRFTEDLVSKYGVPAIIGKGGLGKESTEALRKHVGAYLGMVGGTAALATSQVEEIEGVFWEDLFPECLWQLRVMNFGPLIVGIDSNGENLYLNVRKEAERKITGL